MIDSHIVAELFLECRGGGSADKPVWESSSPPIGCVHNTIHTDVFDRSGSIYVISLRILQYHERIQRCYAAVSVHIRIVVVLSACRHSERDKSIG